MQANELAALFSRNLTLQGRPAEQAPPAPEPIQIQPEAEPIIYSVSQHYTHSAHISREPEPPRPASEPPQTEQPHAELILSQHGVDHTALSTSQMELFKTADDTQKMRLIELWHICPPTNQMENPALALASSTLEQEELLAQIRYERKMSEDNDVMSMDGTPLTPVQADDGRWVATTDSEPYMMSGYEALARRDYEDSAKQSFNEAMAPPKAVFSHFGSAVGGATYRPATDPVYNHDWRSRQEAMENQYGAFQEMEL